MKSPYDINRNDFIIKKLGSNKGRVVFLVETENHNALDGCNFRRDLTDFAMNEMTGDFYIGHDEQYAKNIGNNYIIAIKDNDDVARLSAAYKVIQHL